MTDHANELRRHARKIPHPQGETPGVMLRAADEIERLQSVIASPYSMTRDDVIRMAREAGFRAGHIELYNSDPMPFVAPCSATDCMPEIERFAAIVAGSGAAEIEALRARIAEMERQEPIGWFTEDHLTDRSATTYDAATASRWAEKGWPVGRLYAGPGAQQRPADPAAAEEDDDLYWRLHAMSKSLEGAGRLDEHDNPDAYGTVLDAMNFVKQHSGQRGEE